MREIIATASHRKASLLKVRVEVTIRVGFGGNNVFFPKEMPRNKKKNKNGILPTGSSRKQIRDASTIKPPLLLFKMNSVKIKVNKNIVTVGFKVKYFLKTCPTSEIFSST